MTAPLVRALLLMLLLAAAGLACAESSGGSGALYIALGDSLSAGVGASDPGERGFVPLVRDGVGEVELLNLGHSGDTSQDLFDHGHLDRAVREIEARAADTDPANDVRLVTLEIGGNDLLRLYFSLVVTGVCPDLQASLGKDECTGPLRTALSNFEPNLATALERLRAAAPELPVLLLTLYNPFEHLGPTGDLGVLSLEGMAGTAFEEGMNDLIRGQADAHGAVLVDIYAQFQGEAARLIAGDLIHPNDAGYAAMAEAVLAAWEQQ
jgi:lysophospholipase L1-like esterase